MVNEVIISDEKRYEEVKQKIKKAGLGKLHILSDFDRTITYGLGKDGKRTPTVISQLRSKPDYLGEEYVKEANKLYDTYRPIEINNSIPLKEKIEKMNEWWEKHFVLIAKSGLSLNLIKQVVKENPLQFRRSALEFFLSLHESNVPIFFITAGPGDLAEEYLKQNKIDFPEVYIVGNRYNFNKEGKAISVRIPLVHTFNKTEVTLKGAGLYDKVKDRKNVILLGDSIGDVGMIEGFDYDNLLKIGFLNEDVEKNLSRYKENFDVVITNDGDFDFINKLFKELKE
jgi:5'-nucleotidase